MDAHHARLAFRTVLALVVLAGGCRELAEGSGDSKGVDGSQIDAGEGDPPPDASSGEDKRPSADAGIVEPVGSPERIDVATWNIENFPLDDTTPERVAEIIAALKLDLVAVQEIADEDAFDRLLSQLEGYDDVLSYHEYPDGEYQKVGYIYREDLLDVVSVDLLFNDDVSCEEDGAYSPFPRPPLEVVFDVGGPFADLSYTFAAINVHLKAGSESCDDQCHERRICANRHLEAYVSDQVSDPDATDNVMVLGDFNETLDVAAEDDPYEPWDSGPYQIRTTLLGEDDYSFVYTQALLDHAILTEAMKPDFGDTQVIYLERELDDYTDRISDHLPLFMSFEPAD